MKSETLVQHHPPTPPNVGADLHHDVHQLAKYNADSQSYGSSYGSPGPVVPDGLSQHSSHVGNQPGEAFGLGIQYDGYGQGSGYYQESQYHELTNTQAMVPNSPPTPISASELDDSQGRTRSGRTIAPSSSPLGQEKPRPKATPKSRKAKGKADKPTTPKLNAPLSILTSKFTHIPVRNIEEWVNRPVEVRRKEVDKGNGYVKRPMNSFILYRSAYADRTKQWCLQNNHQVISSVAGQSWPLEPPEIRELYIEYAKIERINHQNAHPTYKFSPSKASTPARKRKGESSDDEPSDLDDAKWNPEHDVRSRLRHSRRPERALSYHMNGMSADYFDRSFGPNGHDMNKSSWEMTNEGRPVPMHLAQGDLYNQYYQNSMQPNMAMAGMEDMRLRRVDTPGASMQYSPEHGILGLPGGNAADIMQQMHSNAGTPLGEAQVDPMLLAYDGGHHHDVGATVQHPEFQNGHMGIMERELNQQSVDSLIAAGHGQEVFHPASWQPDPHMGHIDQESEFEKWMSDQ